MKNYIDFSRQLYSASTDFQKCEVVDRWIGSEVELIGTIDNIDRISIQIKVQDNRVHRIYELVFFTGGEAARLRTELLSYSAGDMARVVAKLCRWDDNLWTPKVNYRLDFVSISIVHAAR